MFETPTDSYYLIAPKGEFPHADAGVVQVVDDTAVRAMAKAFAPGEELLCDFEHDSHDPDKPTRAAGWIQGLVAREDGLWALIRWSGEGSAAVKSGVYRYISPVWLAKDCETLGGNRVRPLRLYDAGLTNRPNLIGIPALSNRGKTANDEQPSGAPDETTSDAPRENSPSQARPATSDATEAFAALVRNVQARKKKGFERAWDEAERRYPDAYLNMLRQAADQGNSRIAAWLNKRPETPIDDMQSLKCPHEGHASRFINIVERHREETGDLFEVAWEKCKRSHPADYGNFVRYEELTTPK